MQWFERPALIVNKINASVSLKINQNTSLQETAFLRYSNHRRASNPTNKTNMRNSYIYQIVFSPGGAHLSGRKASNDTAARRWLQGLLDRGVIAGIAVQLQRYEGQEPTPKKVTADWLFANSTSENWVNV